MSVTAADLTFHVAANMPDDDVSTGGGAIDTSSRGDWTQFSAAGFPELVSDNAGDTMNATVEGRLASGIPSTETLALDGVTPVLFTISLERITRVSLASPPAGTVLVKQGASGTTRITLPPGFDLARLWFRNSTSEALEAIRYEKGFFKNNHGTLALLTAKMQMTADSASRLEVGIHTAKDDSATIADRKTAPAGVSFVDDSVQQNVPGNGHLEAGEAIGVWLKQTLPGDDPAQKATFTLELAGSTT